ncbi:thioesterase family protein [Undibacterium sp. RTI2.1]|uniref:acyl-CoA thioesterase n=1 Tax=unclassified Undibacterium TaxID=2630295 RepID=UPI002B23549F|nr:MULTISPECIES: thioesterase family protein [unclassified Undibacterium]MEB0030061.1 thioesterase family protein [Undibacterium sp. RTI2.1]MEB0114964.1 thioesterase family protein [Undibacterium sp. RTI2.2]
MIGEKVLDKKLVYTVTIPIRWGDMDALGHVNNTVYFRYMEQARLEWLTMLGCLSDENGNGPVIINAHCTFKKPLKYPDQVEVCTYIGGAGRSSFETIQEMRSVSDGYTLYAEGGAKVVWVDAQTQKSTVLPESIKEKLTELKTAVKSANKPARRVKAV